MFMECENVFCVYEKDGKCILDKVSLDITGQCTECITVEIENVIIAKAKNNFLKKYNFED